MANEITTMAQKNSGELRIDRMLEIIMEAAQGNYNVQVDLNGENDAYDALAMGINLMIDDIRFGIEKIEKEKDFIDNIISSISDLLVVMDQNQQIILVNDAWCRLLGYKSTQEFTGKYLRDILGEDIFEHVSEEKNKFLVRNIEQYLTAMDGTRIPVLFSSSLLKNKKGQVSGIIGIARNIREKKETEEKEKKHMEHLERINRELDQFAYVVSHDLKAPLRAIANLSEWIEEDLGDSASDEIRSNMSILRNRVHRMEALINGILNYSKATRSKVEISVIDMEEMADDLLSIIVPPKFTIVRHTRLPEIRNNRIWMEQILTNLMSNAVKHHHKPEGKIEIGYSEEESFHRFFIADDGPGIPEEYHEKVFAIFQTLEARDKVENTGVGLSIIKKIIEEQGGDIWIESKEGRGSSFCFTIPKELKSKKTL